jgi:hypothetical protein
MYKKWYLQTQTQVLDQNSIRSEIYSSVNIEAVLQFNSLAKPK